MSAGSGFHVRNASVNLNGDSSSSSHLVATGVIVFNNLVRVWKAAVLLFLYTLVTLNAGKLFPNNSAWVSGLRRLNFFDSESKIFWSDFSHCSQHFYNLIFSLLNQGKSNITLETHTAISFCLSHILSRKRIKLQTSAPTQKGPAPSKIFFFLGSLHATHDSKTKLYSWLTKATRATSTTLCLITDQNPHKCSSSLSLWPPDTW